VYAASISLPGMLQTLFGYDALRAGLVMSPSGVSSLAAMVLVGFLMARGADARWMIAAGLVVMAAAEYWMARMNLQISPWQVVGPRMLLTLGLGLLFSPMSVAAYKYVPPHLRGAAIGLLSLLRTEGGSVGTSMATTIQERREQFHLSRLTDGLGPLNAHVQGFLGRTRDFFLQRTGDPARSLQLSVQSLDELRQQQGASLAYFDTFWLGAVLAVALVVLVLLMKRSVAEKGEHIGAE
jgi:DHA2 family multidrug resistance protein